MERNGGCVVGGVGAWVGVSVLVGECAWVGIEDRAPTPNSASGNHRTAAFVLTRVPVSCVQLYHIVPTWTLCHCVLLYRRRLGVGWVSAWGGLVGRWVGGVVVVDGGWTCYYVMYGFLWCIPVPLAIFFPPLVLQRIPLVYIK